MGKIEFVNPGIYTTIQDKGRFGYADKGVPQSGPMDIHSFILANLLLLNKPEKACLEIYMGGVKMFFNQGARVAFCGAQSNILVNGIIHPTFSILSISSGDVVSLPPFTHGQWIYMAIAGNFKCQKIMDSKSFFPGITARTKFKKGDFLDFSANNRKYHPTRSKLKFPDFYESGILSVYPGPDFEKLPEQTRQHLLEKTFTISQMQNRMGIQLEEKTPNQLEEILSTPVYPGTVQLTPSGKMIVLMRDAQVTGGYPRIFHLTDRAISIISQKKPGGKIRFSLEKM